MEAHRRKRSTMLVRAAVFDIPFHLSSGKSGLVAGLLPNGGTSVGLTEFHAVRMKFNPLIYPDILRVWTVV